MKTLTEDQVQSIFSGGFIPSLLSTKEMDFLIGLTGTKLERMADQYDQVESLYRRLLVMKNEMGAPPKKLDNPKVETKPAKAETNGWENGAKGGKTKRGVLKVKRLTPREIREEYEQKHLEMLKREIEEGQVADEG